MSLFSLKYMSNYILLFACLGSGWLFNRTNLLHKKFALGLNKLLIYFFIPLLTLLHLPEIELTSKHFWLIVTPWLVYFFGFLYIQVAHQFSPIDKDARAALIMTSGIGSISFVGFPIFELFYGQQGLSYGIILSLAGTFLVCNSAGVFTGFWYKDQKTDFLKIVRGIFKFPPFLAMVVSVILWLADYEHLEITKEILTRMSSPFSVLALFTIGLQIETKGFQKERSYFFIGQLYKLILAPLLIFLLFYSLNTHNTLVAKICVLGAGIGSMNTIAIVAAELKLRPKLAFLMPGIGIPISTFSLLLIYYLIQ